MPPRKTDAGQDETQAAPDQAPADDLEARFAAHEKAMEERFAAISRDLDAREAALRPREREVEFNTRDRAADATDRIERPSMDLYSPPNQMEVPRGDEYHYRWIAEYVNGTRVSNNIQRRIREGYERVPIDALPDGFIVDEDEYGDKFARNSGLILMRIPMEKKQQRDQYYQRRSQSASQGADQLQGVAGRDAVREDRGTRSLTGRDAQQALSHMSQT